MAIPLYGRSERWCHVHHHLYCLRPLAWLALHSRRVHNRQTRRCQHSPCLFAHLRRQSLALRRLYGRAHRFPHHGLLCRSVGMVPPVYLRLVYGRTQWRPSIHIALLRRLLLLPATSRLVDRSHPCRHPLHHYPWRASRHRACVKGYDATALHPPPHRRSQLVYVARCVQRRRVSFPSRLL